ncbi:LysR family transcriptional regulator [Pseudonocardia sediminis]|nr:LysR family transcriptional regulator [Pseudonocardia sediminis]
MSSTHEMPGFSLRQLSYFVAVAEAGTFAGAAVRLHVSASALSLALDELERTLGVQLTVRRRAHGVRLTAAGTDTLRRARRLLRDAGELAAATDGAGGDVAGTVLLGCYPTLAPAELPALLARFAAAHPRARVEFAEGPQDVLSRRLRDGELDLALLYDHGLDPGLELAPLSSNTPYLVLPSGHRLAGRSSVHLREVADEPMVLFDLPPASDHLMTVCRAAGVSPSVAHRTATVELTRSLVGAGLGYTVLAQRAPGTRTAAGDRVVEIDLADDPAPLGIVLARSRTVQPSATARAFARIATGPARSRPA